MADVKVFRLVQGGMENLVVPKTPTGIQYLLEAIRVDMEENDMDLGNSIEIKLEEMDEVELRNLPEWT